MWNSKPGATGVAVLQAQKRLARFQLGSVVAYGDVGAGFSLGETGALGLTTRFGALFGGSVEAALDFELGFGHLACNLPIGLHLGRLVTVYAAPGYMLSSGHVLPELGSESIRTPVGLTVALGDSYRLIAEGGYTIRLGWPLQLGYGSRSGNTSGYVALAIAWVMR
ncbi:MAG: hypothetical protein H6747_01230 [Deltaproteobacteria bacterium]|nr:hypothetical protein [Deltaproteobacteria bacterium]